MSKTGLDSDIYGDIYGEDDNEYAVPLNDEAEEELEDGLQYLKEEPESDSLSQAGGSRTRTNSDAKPFEPSAKVAGTSTSSASTTARSPSQSDGSLPARPVSPRSSSSNTLSYSAQIAQQFSAYQQTPSQERQQRMLSSKIPTLEGTTSSDSVFGKKPSEMHDAGKMFIGGLNWDTTDEGLRDYFSQFGKVDACTIMRDASGTSRGFAFLTFEDPNAVNLVVGREHFLDGKQIDPKRAIPREEHLRNTRYFVGGLAPSTTAESMKDFFSTYGKVVDATVMVDRESGRSKGFGFVTFEDGNSAEQLVGKIGLVLDEKQIEVKMAQPRNQRDQSRNAGQNPGIFNDASQNRNTPMNIPFTPQQPNPMAMMFQRGMNQIPMMGGGMPMMGMHPMAMMGMGMGGMNNMMGGGMGGMMGAGGMGGMTGMGGMGGMGNMGPMRLGMGPMGAPSMGVGGMGVGAGMAGVGGMGMGMRAGMGAMGGGVGGMNRMGMNGGGPGPARLSSRGQHSFHPYAR
ncbi:hypothetical protein AX14_002930 [Amanita brunnescens Koide BX004]|nr:hypothetical protein AX14_002930 [Amanita brunnescens Koide BX004]